MRRITRIHTIAFATLLLSPLQMLHAQALQPAGHYEGTISSPAGTMALQIDLTQTAKGDMAGTLTIPAQKLTGFPLTNVSVKGKDVSFDIATSGGGYYRGELQANGITGRILDRRWDRCSWTSSGRERRARTSCRRALGSARNSKECGTASLRSKAVCMSS